jgi:dienelactone hydrolase
MSSRESEFASRLARDGYVAVAVDYFTGGGTDNIDLAYDTLVQHPLVKEESIGMVGFSKGSSQAIRFAYRSHKFQDRRVKAIVSYYIGPWVPHYYSEYFPNMLFLHGDQDAIPSSSIERVCEIQSENGLVCEAVIYPGIGHNFDMPIKGPDSYDPKVAKDAYQRTLEFFAKYLD